MGVTVTINGTDRTEQIKFGSLRVQDKINAGIDTCDFSIETGGAKTYYPTIGQAVVVAVDGTTTYGGVITEITQTRQGTVIIYKCRCKDYSQWLNKQLVTERYTNQYAKDIIEDLIADYTTDGFTTTNVEGATAKIKSIAFNEIPIGDCLDKLCQILNYYWYVDCDKDIHFFAKNQEAAAFNLTDTSANFILDSLEVKDDLSQLRNKVKIRGGEAVAEARDELLAGDGESDTFPLANKFSEKPTVTVGGTAKTVGIDYLNQDADYQVMWSYGQKYIRFTAGNIPAAPGAGTTNIVVHGTPVKPIVVEISDAPSIAVYGTYEFMKRNNTIASRDEAIQYALAELQAYSEKLRAGSFETYTPGLRSGQTITINLPSRGIAETFVIQSVAFSQLAPTNYIYRIEIATTKTTGLVDILQRLLKDEQTVSGDDETLLNYFQMADEFTATDEMTGIEGQTSEDYVWEDTPEAGYPNPIIWDKFTWG